MTPPSSDPEFARDAAGADAQFGALPAARPSEELLVQRLADYAPARPVERILATSLGRAQAARAALQRFPEAQAACWFMDVYRAARARLPNDSPRLTVVCQPDLPPADVPAGYDLALLPFTAHGDAELTRELLQQACVELAEGGQLWTSTDNPDDRWLRGELEKLFPRIRTHASPQGVVYSAVRTAPPKKLKDFSCWFAFRDGPRLLQAYSRPGVFSHRRIDTGARCLLETMQIESGMKVVDIGCGVGTVGIAAAARATGVKVFALDSNPRAVECTRIGAAANQLSHLVAALDAEVRVDAPGQYDLALANPPYYSHHRIAELFVLGAVQALRPDGQLLLVTKDPVWYDENLPRWFHEQEILAVRSYFVVRAVGVTNR
ncbi:MAG: methyltransferase [Pirellulales bacterium]